MSLQDKTILVTGGTGSFGQRFTGILDPKKFHLLFPGNDPILDMICDRIINGGEFMLEEQHIAHMLSGIAR